MHCRARQRCAPPTPAATTNALRICRPPARAAAGGGTDPDRPHRADGARRPGARRRLGAFGCDTARETRLGASRRKTGGAGYRAARFARPGGRLLAVAKIAAGRCTGQDRRLAALSGQASTIKGRTKRRISLKGPGARPRQRGRTLEPVSASSMARAAWRPSRIAQTTSDWPRRMSPAA